MVNKNTEEKDKIFEALAGNNAGADFVFKLKNQNISMGAEYAAPQGFISELTEKLNARAAALDCIKNIDPKMLKYLPMSAIRAQAAMANTEGDVEALRGLVQGEIEKANSSEAVQDANEMEAKAHEEKLRELHALSEETDKEYKKMEADRDAARPLYSDAANHRIDAAMANATAANQHLEEVKANPASTPDEIEAAQAGKEHSQGTVADEILAANKEVSPAKLQTASPEAREAVTEPAAATHTRGLVIAYDKAKQTDATFSSKDPVLAPVEQQQGVPWSAVDQGAVGTLPGVPANQPIKRNLDASWPPH